ncbi:MAG: hypothetical protein V4613_04570 [Bacteroidota bacterium]
MKNKNKIFALLIALVCLPSCMMTKCRYSNGWNLDLSGNRGGKNTAVVEKQAASARKKTNPVVLTPVSSTDTALTQVSVFKDSIIQSIANVEKPATLKSTRTIRKKSKEIAPSITRQNDLKHSSLNATKQTNKSSNIFDELYTVFLVFCYIILASVIIFAIILLIFEPLAFLVLLGFIGLLLLMAITDTSLVF